MRPVENLHVEWVEDEAVVLNPRSGELHYLNPPAALVFAAISEYGYEQGIRHVKETQSGVEALDEEIEATVETMLNKGLLVDD